MTTGGRVKAARKAKGWSQQELTMRLGWNSKSRLGDIELGDGFYPTKVDLQLIEQALGLPDGEISQHHKEKPWAVTANKRGLFLKGKEKGRNSGGFGKGRRAV
jgi:transcriptional regulator with XRE-family HTH domain